MVSRSVSQCRPSSSCQSSRLLCIGRTVSALAIVSRCCISISPLCRFPVLPPAPTLDPPKQPLQRNSFCRCVIINSNCCLFLSSYIGGRLIELEQGSSRFGHLPTCPLLGLSYNFPPGSHSISLLSPNAATKELPARLCSTVGRMGIWLVCPSEERCARPGHNGEVRKLERVSVRGRTGPLAVVAPPGVGVPHSLKRERYRGMAWSAG